MKTIEIDDDIYEYLKNKAEPFEEPTPNHVLRRLIGLEKKSLSTRQPNKVINENSNNSKSPRTDLNELIRQRVIQNGQKVFFKYKDDINLSRNYEAKISDRKLWYENREYSMSKLTEIILKKEGYSNSSGSYRGPLYWFNYDGKSMQELWDQYLTNERQY